MYATFGNQMYQVNEMPHEVSETLYLRKLVLGISSVQFSHSVMSNSLGPHGHRVFRTYTCIIVYVGTL